MRILITGGGGFVGSRLSQMALSKGHQVIILDHFRHGQAGVIQSLVQGASAVRGDIRDQDLVLRLADSCDALIHLAAVVGYPACHAEPNEARSINIEGTLSVSKASRRVAKFVYASTGSVYGRLDEMCTENSPTDPLSLYGETKLEGERIALEEGALALRFATLYGLSPMMREALLPNLLTIQAVRSKTIRIYEPNARRTFMHIDDASRAYLHALESDRVAPGVYNVGDPALSMTKARLAGEISEVLRDITIMPMAGTDADGRDYCVDYSKFLATGYTSTMPLHAGIESVASLAAILAGQQLDAAPMKPGL